MEKVVARHPLHRQPRDTDTGCRVLPRSGWTLSRSCVWLGWNPTPMLSRDFKEFVALPGSTTIEYLMLGGYAMALHGRPRDIDDLEQLP
ncbi:MAG: hypothetical protein Q8O52_22075 [Sulfuritalea sp.]|nr:hypothetical protein [Sulfuritalea sp.]